MNIENGWKWPLFDAFFTFASGTPRRRLFKRKEVSFPNQLSALFPTVKSKTRSEIYEVPAILKKRGVLMDALLILWLIEIDLWCCNGTEFGEIQVGQMRIIVVILTIKAHWFPPCSQAQRVFVFHVLRLEFFLVFIRKQRSWRRYGAYFTSLDEFHLSSTLFTCDCSWRQHLSFRSIAVLPPNIPQNATWAPNATTVAGGRGAWNGANHLNYPQGLFVDD